MENNYCTPIPTKHMSREIIGQCFEKEKKLRSLTGEEKEKYKHEYQNFIFEHFHLEYDNSPLQREWQMGSAKQCTGDNDYTTFIRRNNGCS